MDTINEMTDTLGLGRVNMMDMNEMALQGNSEAQCRMGDMCSGNGGVTPNFAQATHWYSMAANQGHARAQFKLGLMYALGLGVQQNYIKAHGLLTSSAALGYEEAYNNRVCLEQIMSIDELRTAKGRESGEINEPCDCIK